MAHVVTVEPITVQYAAWSLKRWRWMCSCGEHGSPRSGKYRAALGGRMHIVAHDRWGS